MSAPPAEPGRPPRLAPRPPRLARRLPVALGLGAVTGLGFAPVGLWPAAILGLAGFFVLVRGGRPRQAAGLGYAFGVGLFGWTITWSGLMGWYVAAVFIAAMAVWMLLVGLGAHLVARLPGWPVWVACLWSGYEWAAARVPFGGFNWIRLAYTTPDQPLSGYLHVLGAPGTSWLVALCAALIVLPRGTRPGVRLAALGAVVAVFVGGIVLLTRPVAPGGDTVAVGMVQGNVDETASPTSMGRPHSVTANHLSESVLLLANARTGLEPAPDFLLWPEESTDYDPTTDATTTALVRLAVEAAGVPILIGTVMEGPGPDQRQTSSLWWDPAKGVTARYDKRNLVPFGEYLPLRSVMLKLFPETALVGAQSVAGTRPGVLAVTLPDGRALGVGDMICYELTYDATAYDTVRHGAQILLVQSSNVTFTGTFQPPQQFQITRVRAMELQREIVVATTATYSGLIDAKGRVLDRTAESTAAFGVYEVPVRDTVSWGVRIGPWFEGVAAVLGVLAFLAGLARPPRRFESGPH